MDSVEFGGRIAEILGLPKHTRSFELRCAVNEIVTIKCEFYPEIDGVKQLETIFKDYKLVEWEEGNA